MQWRSVSQLSFIEQLRGEPRIGRRQYYGGYIVTERPEHNSSPYERPGYGLCDTRDSNDPTNTRLQTQAQ